MLLSIRNLASKFHVDFKTIFIFNFIKYFVYDLTNLIVFIKQANACTIEQTQTVLCWLGINDADEYISYTPSCLQTLHYSRMFSSSL